MAKAPKQEIDVLAALKFVARAQREEGAIHQTHCRVVNQWLVSYDGVLACGMPLQTPLPNVCPNTFQFIHALERAKDASSITIEDTTITVKTSKFKATVPCVGMLDISFISPDECRYGLADTFRDAAIIASIFTKEGAQTVAGASVMSTNGTLIGTDGTALIEVWHGNAFPEGLIIPKSFIDAMAKVEKKIVGFGYSETSFSLWFEDQSWIKTQLYSEQWPNVSSIFAYMDTANNIIDVPKDFWEAITAVSAFSEDHRIYFRGGFIRSHNSAIVGAEYKVKDLPPEQAYNYKHLLKVKDMATKFDFTCNERMALFFGDKLRGAFSKMQAPVESS